MDSATPVSLSTPVKQERGRRIVRDHRRVVTREFLSGVICALKITRLAHPRQKPALCSLGPGLPRSL